ncbi:MAG: hypothetical protein OEZ36_03110, partial [Spirochaetota bacterium]|nr:hypothetical protein [Spirochaetota bacterium]
EKIKSLIALTEANSKSELNKKLLYNYRILLKTAGEIRHPEVKEKMIQMLISQWEELRDKLLP